MEVRPGSKGVNYTRSIIHINIGDFNILQTSTTLAAFRLAHLR